MSLKLALCRTGYISKIHAQAAQKLPDVEQSTVVTTARNP